MNTSRFSSALLLVLLLAGAPASQRMSAQRSAKQEAPAPAAVTLRAELVLPGHIRIRVVRGRHDFSTDPADYIVTSQNGRRAGIAKVIWTSAQEIELVPDQTLPLHAACYVTVPALGVRLLCSFDGWMRTLYSPLELGANYSEATGTTIFRILAPRAFKVKLYLYAHRSGGSPSEVVDMQRDENGVWHAELQGNREGQWYDFTVHGPAGRGNEFHVDSPETGSSTARAPIHIGDPYARVSDDSWGRCRVWPKMRPATPLKGGIPKMEDVIAYEVHVEDFTNALPGLPDSLRGTFSGFAMSGLRNAHGAPVGLDHLVDLGINVVHLLPVQEYLNFPDDEWQRAFKDDPYMLARGINLTNYDWGYRTSHAFALESRYRVKGSEPGAQNAQFRDLVQALHDRGIAVIVDVVFNHTAERMDGREIPLHMRVLDRILYYRTNDSLDFIGAYGTETKSEDRPMTARWIHDQCLDLIRQYGVDGFRIDLAGLTDKRTLRELRRLVGDDKIIYGEPWIDSSDPDYEANPDWNWYKADAPITFFQDDTRNAICGPPDNPSNKRTDRGYAGGNGRRDAAKMAVANTFPDEHAPNDGINYLDIHDNWTLADRFASRDWNGLHGVDEGPYRIAAAMLLTSLGPLVMHGGTEFMRSKGAAPNEEVVKRTATGPVYLHGMRDTYNMRTPNLFLWENLGTNTSDGAACNYQRMNDWWKGLIALRRSEAGSVFRVGTTPPAGWISWIEPADAMQLGYIVGGRICVLVNTADAPALVKAVTLPAGTWHLVADRDIAGTAPITGRSDSVLRGDAVHTVTLDAASVKIWVRE